MNSPGDNQNPPPLPLAVPEARPKSWKRKARIAFACLRIAILLGIPAWLSYLTPTSPLARMVATPFKEFRLLHLTNHKRLLAAGRTVLAAPKNYRKHPLLQSKSDAVYFIDPTDPQLPSAIRSLGCYSLLVRENTLVMQFEIGWGRNSGMVVLPEGVEEAPRFARGVFDLWSTWEELGKGLYYYAGTVNS